MKPFRKFRSLFRKDKLDAEMAEEMRHHVELQTELNLKAGMKPDEARYAALRQFGNVAGVQEKARDARGWVWLEQTWQDVRYAVRQLRRSPGFTVVVVLTLGLGVGATTAIFSVVNTVILNPIGGPHPERLIQIGQRLVVNGEKYFQGVSPPVFEALHTQRDLFADLAWGVGWSLDRRTDEFINTESGAFVSWNFFETLQASPFLGRGFRSDEAVLVTNSVPEKDTAIILSHEWWQSQWGGDRQILGKAIELGGHHFFVVGVMPPHFRFPFPSTKFWLPVDRITVPPPQTEIYARMKPDARPGQLQAVCDAMARQLMAEHQSDSQYGGLWRLNQQELVVSFRPLSVALQSGAMWGDLRNTLYGLLVAIVFLLLIVCANVANLALARMERRHHELAVRAALGAGGGRLLRQLLTENLILALLGGAAGLIVTAWSMRLLIGLNGMPRLRPVELDLPLLGIMLLVSTMTGLAFSLAPVWRCRCIPVNAVLSENEPHVTGGRFHRSLLIVGQVAITIVLLTGAGLMLLSVNRLLRVNPGYDPENLITVHAGFPGRKYEPQNVAEALKRRNVAVSQLCARFAALPGVQRVGVQFMDYSQEFVADGRPDRIKGQRMKVGVGESDPLLAVGVPVIAGRLFRAADATQPGLVVINETMAQQFGPGGYAIGKTFRDTTKSAKVFQIIGIVGDAKTYSYSSGPLPLIYEAYDATWPGATVYGTSADFVVRTDMNPESVVPALRRELKAVDANFHRPVFTVTQRALFDSTLEQRTYRNYLGLFAGLGLSLSALGIYGVLACSVTRRTREIGIRLALGADRRQVVAMVIGEGGRLIVIGILIGLLASLGLTRFLQSQLFEVSPTDPLAMLGAVVVLGAIGMVACWLPARRAAKVDPMVALRAE